MNLDLTPQELAFRDEVRAFLDEALTPELRQAGRMVTSVFVDKQYSIPWQKKLHARGWVAPSWPVEYGGCGWNEMQRYIFAAECTRAGAPSLSPMGLRMVGPCIQKYGTPEQKAFYLPRILAGDDYWCQGYSEPGSGSDLAPSARRWRRGALRAGGLRRRRRRPRTSDLRLDRRWRGRRHGRRAVGELRSRGAPRLHGDRVGRPRRGRRFEPRPKPRPRPRPRPRGRPRLEHGLRPEPQLRFGLTTWT